MMSMIAGDIILLTHKTSDEQNQVVLQIDSETSLVYIHICGSEAVYTHGRYTPVKLDSKRIPKKFWRYVILHRPNEPAILTQTELNILRDYQSRFSV